MNLYGQDMDETIDPLQSGLAWTGRSGKRARLRRQIRARGAGGDRRGGAQLLGLVLLDKGGSAASHQVVHTAHGDGEITRRHVWSDAQSIDCARPASGAGCDRRHRARRGARQGTRGAGGKTALRRNGKALVA